jgi:hypothetical protein
LRYFDVASASRTRSFTHERTVSAEVFEDDVSKPPSLTTFATASLTSIGYAFVASSSRALVIESSTIGRL